MKKLNYIVLLSVFFSILIIVSCGDKFNGDDTDAPKVESVRFNLEDTILVHTIDPNDPTKKVTDTVYYNGGNGKEALDEFDILIIGRRILMYSELTDEGEGLSSTIIRIWGDTAPEKNQTDTCYRLRNVPSINIYAQHRSVDTIILNNRTVIPSMIHSPKNKTDLRVREDTEREEYYFSFYCMDIAGNQDTTSYDKHRIRILSRETVVDMWKKKMGK